MFPLLPDSMWKLRQMSSTVQETIQSISQPPMRLSDIFYEQPLILVVITVDICVLFDLKYITECIAMTEPYLFIASMAAGNISQT